MLDAPIRPHRVSANPLLRSALAAGEREPDGQAEDELIHGLFGADGDVELGDENRGMPFGPMPSLSQRKQTAHIISSRDETLQFCVVPSGLQRRQLTGTTALMCPTGRGARYA